MGGKELKVKKLSRLLNRNKRPTVLFNKTKAAYFIRLSVFMRKKLKLTVLKFFTLQNYELTLNHE